MIRILSLLAVLGLSGCTPQAGIIAAPDTGLVGSHTAPVVISSDLHHVLLGYVIDVHRDGERVRALIINQRRDGVHRLRFREAWSNGVELPFASGTRGFRGCVTGPCRDLPVGMIFLSDGLFDHVSAHGLRATLTGYDAAIEINVPASLFQTLPLNPSNSGR